MVKKVLLGFILTLILGWASLSTFLAVTTYQKLDSAQIAYQKLEEERKETHNQLIRTKTALEEKVRSLTKTIQTQEKVLESREHFLAVLPPAQAALSAADNKIDASPFKQRILDAQNIVANEKTNSNVIEEQTQAVTSITEEIYSAIKAYDEEERIALEEANSNSSNRQNTNTSNNSKSQNSNNTGSNDNNSEAPKTNPQGNTQNLPGMDIVRQALNDVGGSWVNLGAADIVCSVDWAAACAHPGGYIEVDTEYLGQDYAWWYPIMLHEYAHQIQYIHWTNLQNAPRYHQLFGGDAEWLADCMSQARMPDYYSAYGYSCSQEQVNYGSGVWSGIL